MSEPGGSEMPSTGPCVNGPDAGRRPRRRWLKWLSWIVRTPIAIVLLVALDREALALGGVLLIVSGLASRRRARIQQDHDHRRRGDLARLARENRGIARAWVLGGVLTEAAAWLTPWPVAAALGAATGVLVWLRWTSN